MKSKEKKKKPLGLIIGNVAFWLVFAFLLSLPVTSFIDRRTNYGLSWFGLRSSIIASSSMSEQNPENTYLDPEWKTIQIGDLVITRNYKSYDEIELYDVLTYVSDNGLICHRVIDKYIGEDGTQFIVTRGDKNTVTDIPFGYDAVRGEVIAVWPTAGKILSFTTSWYFVLAVFASGFFVALGFYIYDGKKEDKAKVAEETNGQPLEKEPAKDTSEPAEQPSEPAEQPSQPAEQKSEQPADPKNQAATTDDFREIFRDELRKSKIEEEKDER